MNQQRLNPYHLRGFACDKCGNEYYDETAYSPAPNLNEINDHHTYCANCVVLEEEPKKQPQPNKNKKSWGSAPINEVSENIQSLNLDKRTLKKTGRVHLFATRVKKEWIEQLKSIAYEERRHYNEVLEKALECYSKHRK